MRSTPVPEINMLVRVESYSSRKQLDGLRVPLARKRFVAQTLQLDACETRLSTGSRLAGSSRIVLLGHGVDLAEEAKF